MNERAHFGRWVEHATRVPFAATRREDREAVKLAFASVSRSVVTGPTRIECPRRVAGDGTRVACSTRSAAGPRER